MEEQLYNLIKAFNRLEDKLESLNSKIDTLLKHPFKNLTLDASAAAKLLGVSTRTLYTLRSQGTIPYLPLGHKILYSAADILKYLRNAAKQEELNRKSLSSKNQNHENRANRRTL